MGNNVTLKLCLWSAKINAQHVPLRQNAEEKVLWKGQEEVWSGDNVFLSLEVYTDLVFVCLFVVRSSVLAQ